MRKKLQSIYVKTDTSCKELAKTALIQLVLKIIYFHNKPINVEEIRSEVNAILQAKLPLTRIEDVVNILLAESKIQQKNNNYSLSGSKKKKFDSAFQEYKDRQSRIIEKYFSPAKSSYDAINNWFENITVTFFTEYRSEWIAQKAYNVKTENAYDGLKAIIKKETNKDKEIDSEDKEWLSNQYIKFFKSSDEDLNSVFWDYGTCAYSSSLITATNSANQITVDTIKNSKFILDTNILMHFQLEGGKFYDSFIALGKIFKELNIIPGYLYITRDEYIRSTANKKTVTINILNNYDEAVIEELEDDFIKTAKTRHCSNDDDYNTFFDELLDIPTKFSDDVDLVLFDNPEINEAIQKGLDDEELIEELNQIFKNRKKKKINGKEVTEEKEEKGKGRKPLMHDAGLITGAEYIRKREKCFILTREISVKQYGIIKAVRDEPYISIGLDTLIGLLALDSGGIDIDPNNFKPLFAKIIKLSLLPEKGAFQMEDLARMLDIEQNIANLPDEDVVSIAKEMHRYQMADMEDSQITVNITRKFQNSKMNLKNDLNSAEAELAAIKNQKDIYKNSLETADALLRKKIHTEVKTEYSNKLRNQKLLYFLVFPLATSILTFLIVYQSEKNFSESWLNHVIGLLINIVAWFLIDLNFKLPQLKKTYESRMIDIDKEVNKRLIDEKNNAT